MTDQKKRKRPRGGRSAGTASMAHMDVVETPNGLVAMPEWEWRTFPVFFGITFGLFVGMYIGVLAQFSQANGNQSVMYLAFLLTGIPFSFALSRIFSRYMIKRGIIKPRQRRPVR